MRRCFVERGQRTTAVTSKASPQASQMIGGSTDLCVDEGGFGTLEDERPAMAAYRLAFLDRHTEIHQIVADDETVGCFCTVTATHTGPYFDLEPAGKRLVTHDMMFNRVRDGRLAETWVMTAGPGFYTQLTGRQVPESVDNLG